MILSLMILAPFSILFLVSIGLEILEVIDDIKFAIRISKGRY